MQPKKLIVLVLVLIVLLAIAGAIMAARDARPSGPRIQTSAEDSGQTSAMLAEPNAIVVLDQRPGDSITVSQAYFDPQGPGGFIAVYQTGIPEQDDGPNSFLGVSEYLAPGEHTNIVIALGREVRHEEILFAYLHADDGDKKFNMFRDDFVPSQAIEGERIGTQFIVDANTATGTPVML